MSNAMICSNRTKGVIDASEVYSDGCVSSLQRQMKLAADVHARQRSVYESAIRELMRVCDGLLVLPVVSAVVDGAAPERS